MENKNVSKMIDLNLDENNNAVIDLMVLDSSVFLSPVCGDLPIISNEVSSYLDNAIKTVPPSFDVKLKIKCKDIDEQQKKVYQSAIKNYYQNNCKQDVRNLISNTWASFMMFIVGVIIITIMIILTLKEVDQVWITILEIIGWVFIWEAVDKFIFERRDIKKDLRKSNTFANAKIMFEDVKYEK